MSNKKTFGMLFAEYFECQFLDDVYDARTNGIGKAILENFENEAGDSQDIKNEIINIIKKTSDKEIQKELLEKLQQLSESFINEEEYLCREYYKFGITDNLQYTLDQEYRRNKKLKDNIGEISDNKVLDDLYNIRTEGFESSYLKRHTEPEEIKGVKRTEEELISTIQEFVIDNEKQEKIIKKVKFLKENMEDEKFFWYNLYYKLGFADGFNGIKQIQEIKGKLEKDN